MSPLEQTTGARDSGLPRRSGHTAAAALSRTWRAGSILLVLSFGGTRTAFGQSAAQAALQARQENPPAPAQPGEKTAPYRPITGRQRFLWFVANTVGPAQLAGGVLSAGYGTARNDPRTYGPGWAGFGDRYGMRLTGVSTGNGIEASAGALWGEDPRYFRSLRGKSLRARFASVVEQTFLARHADGSFQPAYARFLAIPGNNFLSNTWRTDREANNAAAGWRTLAGFAGRMAGNAYKEFWPSMKDRLFHKSAGRAHP